jgi:hypothetical protein
MNLYLRILGSVSLAILLAILIEDNIDLLPIWSEVTAYNMTCPSALLNGKCESVEQTVYPVTFKAIVEKQSVDYWFDTNDAPQHLLHCTVRDARNWSCLLNSNMTEWKMVDGQFKDSANKNAYAVSKSHWWWIKLTE